MKHVIAFTLALLFLSCSRSSVHKIDSYKLSENIDQKGIDNEIKVIENSLIKEIHVKDTPLEEYNILKRMEFYNAPGVSVAVVSGGKVRWHKSYGVADSNTQKKLNEHTLFQAASISKPLSALAILKLVQQGKIDLDADVNVYLKDWKLTGDDNDENYTATIRQLLTHSAGTNVRGFSGYAQSEIIPSTLEILNGNGKSPKLKIVNKPGEKWNYSGGGYVLLQKVVKDVSGVSFVNYMKNEVLLPMGMTQSTFQLPLDTIKHNNVSSGHNNQGVVLPGRWNNYGELAAAGLWTTPGDLAKYALYVQKVMDGGEGFLNRETLELMLTKQSDRNWGLGPYLQGEKDSLIFSHDGSNPGYQADFFSYVYQGDAAIVMTNSDGGGQLAQELLRSISKIYGWNARKQQVIKPLNLSISHLNKLAGKYSWNEREKFKVEFQIRNNELWFVYYDDGRLNEMALIAKGLYNFIHIDSGTTIEFYSSNDVVTGMKWRDAYEFSKIE